MIGRLTHNSGVSPATELTRKAESTKTLCHTPFGDVMVDELSTANRASAFPGRRSAPAVAQPAIVARATQAAVATATSTAFSIGYVAAMMGFVGSAMLITVASDFASLFA